MMRIRTEVWEILETGMTSVAPEGRGMWRFREPGAVPRAPGLMITNALVAREFLHSLTACNASVFTASHAAELACSLV